MKLKMINNIKKYVLNPSKLVMAFADHGMLGWLPDRWFLKLIFRAETGTQLHLSKPKTFSEKIQWLKLFDRNPVYTSMVDKILVKEIASSRIGDEYILDGYGVWDNADEIDFNALPDSFVLKCNHDSGGVVICHDKKSFDRDSAVKLLKKRIRRSPYEFLREWPYKNVKRKIMAEKLLVDPKRHDLIDYKFYCFNGEPMYCQVIQDRSSGETIDFYDMEWNLMPFTGLGTGKGPKRGAPVKKPEHFVKMIWIAKTMAEGTRFVRIDLYNVEGYIYFGEFTLYPLSGLGNFFPYEWNRKLGDMISLD